jgi:hypothetical protein
MVSPRVGQLLSRSMVSPTRVAEAHPFFFFLRGPFSMEGAERAVVSADPSNFQ